MFAQRPLGLSALDGFAALITASIWHVKKYSGSFKLHFKNFLLVSRCTVDFVSSHFSKLRVQRIFCLSYRFKFFPYTEIGNKPAVDIVLFREQANFQNLFDVFR